MAKEANTARKVASLRTEQSEIKRAVLRRRKPSWTRSTFVDGQRRAADAGRHMTVTISRRVRAQAKQKALTSSTNIEVRSRTLQSPNTTLGRSQAMALAAIDNEPRSAEIIAVTDVTVARMPSSVFSTAVHSYPDVCDQLLALLASQIRMLANRVNECTTLDARHRIYAELLRLSRPETGRPGQAVVSPPPAHAEIAARVSIRREAVTRELKSLERAGLIERRRGALVLTDTRRLRQLIEQASEF